MIALLDIGERVAERRRRRRSGFDAVVGRPIKQSRLYDALAGVQAERSPPSEDAAEPAGRARRACGC